MPRVIRIISVVHPFIDDDGNNGRWLVSCDVDANDGRGEVITTDDRKEARIFADVGEAIKYWGRQSTTVPLRSDGMPNKPLTAYTIEVVNSDE